MPRARFPHLLILVLITFLSPSQQAAAADEDHPCAKATGGVTECRGANCALDPEVELEGMWQRVAACVRPLRTVWNRRGPGALVSAGGQRLPVSDVVRNAVYRAMSQGDGGVALKSDPARYRPLEGVVGDDLSLREPAIRIAQLNDRGRPYNAMSQTGMGRILYDFGNLAGQGGYPEAGRDAAAYERLADAMIETVLTPVDAGGLATTGTCSERPDLQCTWFHSVTRKDRDPDQGATLNQDLHAVRDLLLIEIMRQKRDKPGPDLRPAIEAGLNQLFFSAGHAGQGDLPNLSDFIVEKSPEGPSWAYYGFNPDAAPPKGAYLLRQEGRNCHYHYHVLDLMAAILRRTADEQIAGDARSAALACDSSLRRMYDAAHSGATIPAVAPNLGEDSWCLAGEREEHRAGMTFFARQFSDCN